MSPQLPPPQPGPGGTWYPLGGPDGTPTWQWEPDPAGQGSPAPATPPPAPAPPVPAAESGAAPGSHSAARLRKLYVSGAALVVLVAWAGLYVFDRVSGPPGAAGAPVTATVSPTPSAPAKPPTPAELAVAEVEGARLDDKGDGTLVVTLDAGPPGPDRAARVARTTYDLLQALADADVEFEVVVVRGTAAPARGPGATAPPADPGLNPEVYKASFRSKDVHDIDFVGADKESLDGLREHSVNGNLTLEGEG